MAEQYITKKSKKKGVETETTYRIDADFVPTETKQISQEFIENWCVAHGHTEWLVAECSITSFTTQKKNKETGVMETVTVECKSYPFVNLRADFVHKFFPSILKGTVTKGETFAERIKRLYGNK